MSHGGFEDNVITNDSAGRPAGKSRNVWGTAFYATAMWPEKMCIQDYDAVPEVQEDGIKIIRFDVENGFAVYKVIGPCEYGCAWHGELIESAYEPNELAA